MKWSSVEIVTYALNQVEVHAGGQGYWSMADKESIAASSEGVSLPETLDLVADVPNWTVSECCTHHGRMLDVRWFARMFLDGQSKTMADRRGKRHDTDIGARERCWLTIHQW